MCTTKEKILLTSLKLFAQDGYEAVSISKISGELGMAKSALYKHYKNKRDIFDSIVERMYQIDEKRAENHNVPKNEYDKSPSDYENTSCKSLKKFTLSQFEFWTEDEFAVNPEIKPNPFAISLKTIVTKSYLFTGVLYRE